MSDGLDRLKVLINSSTPIVVMETSEEMRAVNMVRSACAELNMATFEWSIADGLLRSGSNAPPEPPKMAMHARVDQATAWTQAVQIIQDSLAIHGPKLACIHGLLNV